MADTFWHVLLIVAIIWASLVVVLFAVLVVSYFRAAKLLRQIDSILSLESDDSVVILPNFRRKDEVKVRLHKKRK